MGILKLTSELQHHTPVLFLHAGVELLQLLVLVCTRGPRTHAQTHTQSRRARQSVKTYQSGVVRCKTSFYWGLCNFLSWTESLPWHTLSDQGQSCSETRLCLSFRTSFRFSSLSLTSILQIIFILSISLVVLPFNIYIHIHINTCTYICIYTHTYICIYIYVYTYTFSQLCLFTELVVIVLGKAFSADEPPGGFYSSFSSSVFFFFF